MLILSKAKVTIREAERPRVEGLLEPYRAKIATFVADLGLASGTIRYRYGKFVFSRNIDPAIRQRLLNFFVNECPLK